ncbi:MAG: hypothetical protein NWE78_01920 [Candidatus Bathyarchaeota archaeon]|nr:hypothetical protein [Candidatus Bathyarchaeota archaeon]
MIDAQTISIVIAAASIVIATAYYITIVRNANRARQAQLFMQFHSKGMNKELIKDMTEINLCWTWKDADEFFQKYGPETNPDAWAKFVSVWAYYEGMGTLVKKNLINVEIIPEILAIAIVDFWEKIQPVASKYSQQLRRPQAFDGVELLYHKIRRATELERT